MKILLLGECSNVHWNLAQALKQLGHEVCFVAPKNWMDYNTSINLNRKSNSIWDGIKYITKLSSLLPSWRNFDVVQINNISYFLALKINKNFTIYNYLKNNNKKIFLAGYASDYYWLKSCLEDRIFRYSTFQIGDKDIMNSRTVYEREEWLHSSKKDINIKVANSCNGIPACLYEYYAAYQQYFPNKTEFLPLPIDLSTITPKQQKKDDKVNFFIGIQSDRNEEKGTDIMYRALKRVHEKYPEKCTIKKAVSVPYNEYQNLMNDSDVILDQLYSYTPSMNSLLAMAKGLIVIGGGEEENYQILGEKTLRPIINVLPDEDDVFKKLENLILRKEQIPELSSQSIEYVYKYHSHLDVAKLYLDFWSRH